MEKNEQMKSAFLEGYAESENGNQTFETFES